ncbi:MAG: 50S ribosomal protein L5 [Lentisphaeria bacterium]|jgi:large subunit ribosomal protein L5|nr:50S ribosomal protein L5 [Lentisphaeria bacterium]MDP7740228.1 50S ribosomal protein L5 [Lentisphaeria bacterium]
MSVLMDTYRNDILPELRTKRGYGNVQEVPRITKIVVSSGIGSDKDREVFDEALRTLGDIVGQRPIITKAKTSIAGFKLREGQNVGISVTLRGQRMYDFLYRLINVALPRVRDFRGVSSTAFDGAGNYSLGLNEQSIFTEIDLDKMKYTIGMNVTIVTTAKTDEEGLELLTMLGMPFAT